MRCQACFNYAEAHPILCKYKNKVINPVVYRKKNIKIDYLCKLKTAICGNQTCLEYVRSHTND